MKSILTSIRPRHVADILNGRKTIELRKTYPHCALPIDVYIYCTKGKDRLVWDIDGHICIDNEHYAYGDEELNGKVVARFWCDKVEPTNNFYEEEICSLACISKQEYFDYLGYDDGYAIHITNLEIFDKPKELSEFKVWGIDYPTGIIDPLHDCNVYYKKKLKPLTRAPQSWCYVEIE